MTGVGADTTPTTTQVIARSGRGTGSSQDGAGPASWADVADLLRTGSGTSWLSVIGRHGGVHTRPLFAAWGGTSFFFATKSEAAGTSHLRACPDVSLSVDLESIHLVTEGTAHRLTEPDDLQRASTAMLEVFEWPTEVIGDLLDAPYAAPTSGGPPFEAWELVPRRVLAFPTQDQVEPTRFLFD